MIGGPHQVARDAYGDGLIWGMRGTESAMRAAMLYVLDARCADTPRRGDDVRAAVALAHRRRVVWGGLSPGADDPAPRVSHTVSAAAAATAGPKLSGLGVASRL